MKKILFFVLAALTFAACEQAPVEEQSAIRQEAPDTITVGFEDDDTRIQLNEAQKTVWTNGDLVSVFYRSNANQQWKYNGETGTRTAELKRVDAGTATRDMDRVVVVYPYNEDYYINPSTYNVQASLPAVQSYLKDSYGTNGNIMISSSEYNQFSLKSVCGWLKLQLTGDGETIKSIKFRGNDGEQVAGELYINSADATAALASEMGSADDNNAGGNLVFEDTILTEVTLDCGEGVALGKNATAFYIALPPQTFEHGFTVEIEDTEGYVMEQSTDKVLIIERNHIQPMAAFEFINPATPSAPAPTSNEIWYTATEKADPYFDDFLTFGSDVVSNVWDSETKRGIITFDGDITMIGDDAFNNCDKFTGITLPECVTSIGENAFYDCDGLTEFTIPDSVTTIGNSAFYSCSSLQEFNGKFASEDGRCLIIDGSLNSFAPAGLTKYTIPNSVTSIGDSAFAYCDSLTSVNIPDGVTTIGYLAFCGCTSLTEFKGKFAEDNGRILVIDGVLTAFAPAGITEYNIPDSVTEIGYSAFLGCTNLTSVNIPDSVTTIGWYAFSYCTSLTEFTGKFAEDNGRILVVDGVLTAFAPAGITEYNIPDSVTEIGFSAFWYCDSLTSVNIPDSVTEIYADAFRYCYSLTSVYCKATTPPSLGYDVFDNNGSGRKIYVPAGSVNAYKSATKWSEYASAIVGYDFENGVVVEGYGIDDSNLDPNKYLTYVANHSHLLDFESEDYYYWDTYFKHNVNSVMVAEYKFQFEPQESTSNDLYISDDYIYIQGNKLYVYSESYYNDDDERRRRYNSIDLTTLGIQPTDLIVLRLDAINNTITINGHDISVNKIGIAMSSYIFSSYYSESDEGHLYSYEGVTDGSKLYYAKGWNENGYLVYLGHASTDTQPSTGNVEACWRARYYNSKVIETTTFANSEHVENYVPLGMGNM